MIEKLSERLYKFAHDRVQASAYDQFLSLISEVESLESRLAEAEKFRDFLIALGHLNESEDAYFCAYEEDCKMCTEKDWSVCLGYNVKLAAEKAEASLRGEAEKL